MFNILTPTYNRENTLDRVYNSLKVQSDKRFKWIIVDDGSSDNTEILVNGWITSSEFHIIYKKLPYNIGKISAVNSGLEECSFPYTIIADSDDSFVSNTLSSLLTLWKGIELSEEAEKIGAIWTLVRDERGILIGNPFPKNFWQVSFKERVLANPDDFKGEKWHCWRTEVIREYGILVPGEGIYVPESTTWNRINKKFDFLCVNICHRTYWRSEDGIMATPKSKLANAKIYYYATYYQLRDLPISEWISYTFYRQLAFEHIKSRCYYKDNSKKLSARKLILAWGLFILIAPLRILKKWL